MLKYMIFKEMLDYMAHISEVTDADMNYCDNIRIVGETDQESIVIEVTIKNKEEVHDGN